MSNMLSTLEMSPWTVLYVQNGEAVSTGGSIINVSDNEFNVECSPTSNGYPDDAETPTRDEIWQSNKGFLIDSDKLDEGSSCVEDQCHDRLKLCQHKCVRENSPEKKIRLSLSEFCILYNPSPKETSKERSSEKCCASADVCPNVLSEISEHTDVQSAITSPCLHQNVNEDARGIAIPDQNVTNILSPKVNPCEELLIDKPSEILHNNGLIGESKILSDHLMFVSERQPQHETSQAGSSEPSEKLPHSLLSNPDLPSNQKLHVSDNVNSSLPKKSQAGIDSVPSISNDPTENDEENDDDNDLDWGEQIPSLRTDNERYNNARECWRNQKIPNPNRNLTVHNYRKHFDVNINSCANVGNKRKRSLSEPDEGLEPRTKRFRQGSDVCHQLFLAKLENVAAEFRSENEKRCRIFRNNNGFDAEIFITNSNYLTNRYHPQWSQRYEQVKKYVTSRQNLQSCFDNKVANLNESWKEIIAFQNFYCNDVAISSQQGKDINEQENMYKLYEKFY